MMDDEAQPEDIQFEDHVFDIACHPANDLVAAGLINGKVYLYHYSVDGDNTKAAVFNHHKKSCRSLLFSGEGGVLLTASSDCSLQAVNLTSGEVFYKQKRAHENPINVMHRFNAQVIATGDDEGAVKLWDLRQQTCVRDYSENEDFVSDMLYVEDKNTLLVTSGDGSMTIYDIRKTEPLDRTDMLKDELLSIALMKSGSQVVCGSQSGLMYTYTWGEWFDDPKRFPGHPQSVDAVVKITEDLMVTGSSDGLIRILSVQPDDLVGIVGEHDDFPVERMRLSHDKKFLMSCSHDNSIKFWNINYLYDEDGDEKEDSMMEMDEGEARKNKGKKREIDEDAEGEEGAHDEESGDEGQEDEEEAPRVKKQKTQDPKGKGKPRGRKNFFKDL